MHEVRLCPKSPQEQHLRSPKQSRCFQFPFHRQDRVWRPTQGPRAGTTALDWECGSGGQRLPQQARGPGFNSQHLSIPVLLYRYKEKMEKKNLWNLGGVVKMLNFTLNGFHINKSKISKIATAPGRSASQLSRYHEQGHQDMEGYGGGVSISQEELVLVKRDSLTHSLNPL